MAKDNLAQSEQILNLLQQSLREICSKHELVQDSINTSQAYSRLAQTNLNKACIQAKDLSAIVKQLNLTWYKFEKDKQ